MELMLRQASSGEESPSQLADGPTSARTVRVRVLSAFRTGSFRMLAGRGGLQAGAEKIAGQVRGPEGRIEFRPSPFPDLCCAP
jgi:hypothetical protein